MEITKIVEKGVGYHVVNHALDSKEGEGALHEAWVFVSSGFPLYGLSPYLAVLIGVCLVGLVIAYSIAGKGTGSHAGREEVRRSYRRELAKQMARQDAEQIKEGKKVRRKWMQW